MRRMVQKYTATVLKCELNFLMFRIISIKFFYIQPRGRIFSPFYIPNQFIMNQTPQNTTQRSGFSSGFGVLAATLGSAVGLGNIWMFPYQTGASGGARGFC